MQRLCITTLLYYSINKHHFGKNISCTDYVNITSLQFSWYVWVQSSSNVSVWAFHPYTQSLTAASNHSGHHCVIVSPVNSKAQCGRLVIHEIGILSLASLLNHKLLLPLNQRDMGTLYECEQYTRSNSHKLIWDISCWVNGITVDVLLKGSALPS